MQLLHLPYIILDDTRNCKGVNGGTCMERLVLLSALRYNGEETGVYAGRAAVPVVRTGGPYGGA
jgi:hypothetical protein